MLRARALNDMEELLYAKLKKDHCIIGDRKMPFAMWVNHVQGPWLQDPLFERRGGQGRYDLTVRAREGRLKRARENRKVCAIMRFGTVRRAAGSRLDAVDRHWDGSL